MSTRTIADIEADIAALKNANPNWLTDAGDKALITSLINEKNLLSAPVQQVVEDQQEDPAVIKGVYERLEENESEPPVDTFITFDHITLLVRQEWIAMKDAILAGRADNLHRTIFLRGTSGRGKTSFVYYLMYCILINAKKTKAEQERGPNVALELNKRKTEQEYEHHAAVKPRDSKVEQESAPYAAVESKAELESDPHAAVKSKKRKAEQESDLLIGYVCNEGRSEAKFLLTLSHVKRVASIPSHVYYYISDVKSDENRIRLAKYFTMIVASDVCGKKEFHKRLQESSGETYTMPPPKHRQKKIDKTETANFFRKKL